MPFRAPARIQVVSALILAAVQPAVAQMSIRPASNDISGDAVPMVTGNAGQIAAAMSAAGMATSRSEAGDGTPKLDGNVEGWGYSVYFYGCNGDDCDAIQFAAGFAEDQPMNHDVINDWNRDNRFGRAYLDAEGDPWVEMDVNMEGDGIAVTNFVETLAYWQTVLPAFVNHIGW